MIFLIFLEFCPDCPLHKDLFPLDIFKYIVYLTYLHLPALPSRRLAKFAEQIRSSKIEISKIQEQFSKLRPCASQSFRSTKLKEKAEHLEDELSERNEELMETQAIIEKKMKKMVEMEERLTKTEQASQKLQSSLENLSDVELSSPASSDKLKQLQNEMAQTKKSRSTIQRQRLFDLQALLEKQNTWIHFFWQDFKEQERVFDLIHQPDEEASEEEKKTEDPDEVL